jgi:O-antigen ligase
MVKATTLKIKHSNSFNPLLSGTIGYLFLFIFRPFEYWEWLGTYHVERIYMIGLIFAAFLLAGMRYKHHFITTMLLIFFGIICFSTATSFWPDKALDRLWEYFKLMVLFFVILLSVRDEKDFRILIIAVLAITGVYVGKSLWEFLFHGRYVYRMGIRRLCGIDSTFGDPNAFAATIIYSLPFAWALWKTKPSELIKKGLIFYGLMSMVSVALTGSRSGMVAFIFLLIVLWAKGKKKVLGAVGLVLVLMISWYAMPTDLQKRFETIYDDSINASATASAQGRIEGLKMGIKLFEISPIWGVGAGCSPIAVDKLLHYERKVQLHNLYGQLLAELGILGAISFLALIFSLVKTQRKVKMNLIGSNRNNILISQAALASINVMWLLLFEGLFGHNLYRYTWIWISAIFILADHLSKRKQLTMKAD